MPDYTFSGRDSSGNKISGKCAALTSDTVASKLLDDGIIPLEIKEIAKAGEYLYRIQMMLPGAKVSVAELLMFCRQMYTLSKAGIPIVTAVTRLSETSRNLVLIKALQDIIQTLSAGRTFSFALSRHPKIFSPLFINIVAVGESSGKLEDVFVQLASYLDLEQQTQKRIKTALRYPSIVIISAIVALIVINTFVIPSFSKMFASFKTQLPLPTRILMAMSSFTVNNWPVLLGGTILFIGLIMWYLKTPKGKLLWYRVQLRLPLIGWIIMRVYLARFCRLFSLIVGAGIPAIEGIELVANSIGNDYLALKIREIRDLVNRGSGIAAAARQVKLFSPLVIQMMSLGEETGKMEAMLIEVAEFYEREVEYDLGKLSDAIEPILLLVMAGMVLVLALGVFLPMWDMASLAGSR